MTTAVIAQRLFLVTLIAGAIGYERERHGRAAGFRTHILVGVGSCLVMLTGFYVWEAFPSHSNWDPSHMAAQVVSGIGFLGAGTILRFRSSVRGLTTAASLWAVGGVGLAIGAGFLVGGLLTGFVILMTLFAFARLEYLMRRDWYRLLVIETRASAKELARIRGLLADYDIEVRDFDIKTTDKPEGVRLEFHVKLLPDHPRDDIIKKVQEGSEHVVEAHWA